MEGQFDICNQCGKAVQDYCDEIGWIKIDVCSKHMENAIDIFIVKEKIGGGTKNKRIPNPLDFCCFGCLREYFENIIMIKE